ncbi:hypothetical protein EYZ11_011328 [Aspergillus tanneri]|uniref:Uncharacterized protein n=1 Tax=Aspergillus tanneri TaxID=1220188 RepID=A0A4S3J3P9_9EURO|nr:hypothetical protein EYZ11_011328 [Aspergillus tanneri]
MTNFGKPNCTYLHASTLPVPSNVYLRENPFQDNTHLSDISG